MTSVLRLGALLVMMPCAALAQLHCDGPLNSVEKIVCEDVGGLDDLDAELNATYEATVDAARDKAALRQEQRHWLATERNRCPDRTCIWNAMKKRIKALYDIRLKAQPPLNTPLDEVGAQHLCGQMARLADDRKLRGYVVPGDGNYELQFGSKRPAVHFQSRVTPGTCVSSSIVRVDPPNEAVRTQRTPVPSEESYDDPMDTWGTKDSLIYIQRRFMIVRSDYVEIDRNPGLVKWIMPNGMAQSVCELAISDDSAVATAADPEVCSTRDKGTLATVTWSRADLPEAVMTNSDGTPIPNVDMAETASVDLDGDGVEERVARLKVSSGAGCGSHESFLLILTSDGQQRASTSLAKVLQQLPLADEDDAEIYLFGKHAFVEGDIRRSIPAKGLVSFEGQQPKQVCTFKTLHSASRPKLTGQ